jgi:adenosine deaminase
MDNMKKRIIAISTIATAILAGGSIAYVQNTPKTDTTSETEKVAQHISLNYKLNKFGLNMTKELLEKLQQQDKDTNEFIYKKQAELGNLIREIEKKDDLLNDSLFQSNQAKQIAYADTLKDYLSAGLAYYELHSEENRDKLLEANLSMEKVTKELLLIDEKIIDKYNLTIGYSGKTDKESDSKKVEDIGSRGIKISYKDGLKTHTIEIN